MFNFNVLATISRYFLGLFYLVGAIDGFLYLVFGTNTGPKPTDIFFTGLIGTTYFWAFMKLIQFFGAVSLLLNFKPVLGFTLLLPITSVLFMYYIAELHWYLIATILMVSSLILFNKYAQSYRGLLMKH